MNYEILFPDNYDIDDFEQFEVESKGCLSNVVVIVDQKKIILSFYEIERLRQDSAEEVSSNAYFFEANLVIISKVTKDNIKKAIALLIERNEYKQLL